MSIRDLQEQCGKAAEAKGFHDDRPLPASFTDYQVKVGRYDKALTNWQGNKLMLIVSEVVEAHDELRKGHAANRTYYPDMTVNGVMSSKPEGVPSELADVVIRVLDFCYTEGIDLEAIINEKLAFNATRERLHGKTF